MRRYKRDQEVNNQKCKRLLNDRNKPFEIVAAHKLRVGDLIIVDKDERVPADLVLLRTSESSGAVFVRTDQLDGETDWKLRLAVPTTQKLATDHQLFEINARIYAEKPQKDIHSFIGTFSRVRIFCTLQEFRKFESDFITVNFNLIKRKIFIYLNNSIIL